MRTLLVLASVAAVATLSYVFGPDFVEAYHERETLVAESQVLAVATDANQSDKVTFEPKTDTVAMDGVSASLTHLKKSVTAKPARPEGLNRSEKKKAKPATRRRTAEETRSEMESMGIRPATQDLAQHTEDAPKPVVRPKANVNPMAGRWIEGLSGPKARLDMGVKGGNGSCADAYSHCERPDAPKDINVTGVVVRTEHLARHPHEPVQGKVRRGHFLDETPVVYVE